MRVISLGVFLSGICLSAAVAAHEFWIAPEDYHLSSNGTPSANLKNGQNFEGYTLSYLSHRTLMMQAALGGTRFDIPAREGDMPAIRIEDAGQGLLSIAYETAPATLTYNDWEKFTRFAEHKDFPDIEARHRARGLPETGFTETYRRFSKALIGIGAADGADISFGLETEFVALTNPYAPDYDNTFRAGLWYQGKPRIDAQVEVFIKAPNGKVTIEILRTDSTGEVMLKTTPGREYMLDAVVLREATDTKAVWETLWANMTFAVPE